MHPRPSDKDLKRQTSSTGQPLFSWSNFFLTPPPETSTSKMTSKSSSSSGVIHRPAHLTHAAAKLASAACIAKAKSIGVPMNIAIVDGTLHLLHFERMPSAKLTSVDIAMNKAFTAAGHKAPTSVYKENVWPGGPAFGLNNSNGGRFMYVAGGIPITIEGEVVGAIGCSTGTPAQDTEVSQAGVDAVMKAYNEGNPLKSKL